LCHQICLDISINLFICGISNSVGEKLDLFVKVFLKLIILTVIILSFLTP
jgi:hypothetical protein